MPIRAVRDRGSQQTQKGKFNVSLSMEWHGNGGSASMNLEGKITTE